MTLTPITTFIHPLELTHPPPPQAGKFISASELIKRLERHCC
ncbi:hypothetical protein [Microcoleus sp. FACHB-SPT15]|nr:hypothetical protein [Microcoleus sp. FACHB-SPT15]